MKHRISAELQFVARLADTLDHQHSGGLARALTNGISAKLALIAGLAVVLTHEISGGLALVVADNNNNRTNILK